MRTRLPGYSGQRFSAPGREVGASTVEEEQAIFPGLRSAGQDVGAIVRLDDRVWQLGRTRVSAGGDDFAIGGSGSINGA